MLPSIVGEAIGALLLAVTIVALATLLQRARRQRADAELAVAFEREIASDLLEQADALDRLVAAVAGLQDDLDEQRVLDRLASATRQLLQADAALVVETSEDGLLVCAAHDAIDPTLVPPPLTRAGNVAETLQAAARSARSARSPWEPRASGRPISRSSGAPTRRSRRSSSRSCGCSPTSARGPARTGACTPSRDRCGRRPRNASASARASPTGS